MALKYKYVLDSIVLELFMDQPASQRRQLLRVFQMLSLNPFQSGDSSFLDSSGRSVQKKRIGQWFVFFWPDHAAKEVRIVGIQKFKIK